MEDDNNSLDNSSKLPVKRPSNTASQWAHIAAKRHCSGGGGGGSSGCGGSDGGGGDSSGADFAHGAFTADPDASCSSSNSCQSEPQQQQQQHHQRHHHQQHHHDDQQQHGRQRKERLLKTIQALKGTGLFDVVVATASLVQRNQKCQQELLQLQADTVNFLQDVLSNPQNRNAVQLLAEVHRGPVFNTGQDLRLAFEK